MAGLRFKSRSVWDQSPGAWPLCFPACSLCNAMMSAATFEWRKLRPWEVKWYPESIQQCQNRKLVFVFWLIHPLRGASVLWLTLIITFSRSRGWVHCLFNSLIWFPNIWDHNSPRSVFPQSLATVSLQRAVQCPSTYLPIQQLLTSASI
jgi:hypothetical protein